ncbi:MAG: hypothetical protein HOE30_25445, partial [Deltaproteobacteria bacterium]|nr:hypothetical protein [Deltaproteobacteria bacterium]
TLGIRKFVSRNMRWFLVLGLIASLISVSALAIRYRSPIGAELSHSYWPQEDLRNKNIKQLLRYAGYALNNKIKTAIFPTDAPTLFVDVKFKHFRKLNEWRKKSIAAGFGLAKLRQYVPATIRHGSMVSKVKIRLKGDLIDHYDSERWSFRIKIKGENSFLGMKTFSIQEPERRGYAAEAVFFQHLRQYDILVPRYIFVNVIFNGQTWGMMALEEVPSKELLESSRRREGVIFRYDDSSNWLALVSGKRSLAKYYQNHHSTPFAPYGRKKIGKSQKLFNYYLRGISLLEGWREGRLKATDIFDVERWARLFAISEVWRSRHQLKSHNLRFYLNPVTEKFEPLVYDRGRMFYNDTSNASSLLITRDVPFVDQLLQEPKFRLAFVDAMKLITNDVISGRGIDKIRPMANLLYKQLVYDKFYLMEFPFQSLISRSKALLERKEFNQKDIRVFEYPEITEKSFESIGHGLFYRDGKGISIELSNKLPIEVHLCGLTLNDPANKPAVVLYSPGPHSGIRLKPASMSGPHPISHLTKKTLKFALSGEKKVNISRLATVSVCLETASSDQPVYETIFQSARPFDRSIAITGDNNSASTLASQFSFIKKVSDNSVAIRPGVWRLTEPLVVPMNVSLEIPAGVTMIADPNALIVVHGSTRFLGNASNPVVLKAINDKSHWKGIVVFHGANDRSSWRNVVIKNTTMPEYLGWTTTGAVTLHNGQIKMENVLIEGSIAEDALNIISADILLKQVRIRQTRSDAFDCDFCNGSAESVSFIDIGGDGLDISGTNISIGNADFFNIHDKAISVGEGSHLVGETISIKKSAYAVVSKDSSSVSINNIDLENILNIGFMTYKKKSEYPGPEILNVRNLKKKSDFQLFKAAHGSLMSINDNQVVSEEISVKELYSKGVMKKNRSQ